MPYKENNDSEITIIINNNNNNYDRQTHRDEK